MIVKNKLKINSLFSEYIVLQINMQYYAFTIKNTFSKAPPTYEDYNDWMDNAKSKGFDIQMVGFELDSKQRLHLHGVALATPRLTFKKLTYRKFHQYIEAIASQNDLMRWSDYCRKDYDKRYDIEQKVISQGIQNTYSFV